MKHLHMKYSKVNKKDIEFFDELIEGNNVFFDQNTLDEYSHDETSFNSRAN